MASCTSYLDQPEYGFGGPLFSTVLHADTLRGRVRPYPTNSIAQGDTREGSLTVIANSGGSIYSAIRRVVWPGESSIIVFIIHVAKQLAEYYTLDGRRVRRISAYLVEGDLDDTPASLVENARRAFIGSYILAERL